MDDRQSITELPVDRREFMQASGGVAGLGLMRQFTNKKDNQRRGAKEITPTYVPLNFRTPGALYEPSKGQDPRLNQIRK